MAYNPDFKQIGEAFVKHYYQLFDTNHGNARAIQLANLYGENSLFTFEQLECIKGRELILQKIGNLPFKTIQRAMTAVDCQPHADGSIVVFVIGQLKADEDPVNSYSHCFMLSPGPTNESFYIANELFRLVIHG